MQPRKRLSASVTCGEAPKKGTNSTLATALRVLRRSLRGARAACERLRAPSLEWGDCVASLEKGISMTDADKTGSRWPLKVLRPLYSVPLYQPAPCAVCFDWLRVASDPLRLSTLCRLCASLVVRDPLESFDEYRLHTEYDSSHILQAAQVDAFGSCSRNNIIEAASPFAAIVYGGCGKLETPLAVRFRPAAI